MKPITGYAVIRTAEGLATVAVREGETGEIVAGLYAGELVDEFPNRWLADNFRRELAGHIATIEA